MEGKQRGWVVFTEGKKKNGDDMIAILHVLALYNWERTPCMLRDLGFLAQESKKTMNGFVQGILPKYLTLLGTYTTLYYQIL